MFNWNERLTENSGRASNTGSSCAAKKNKKSFSTHSHIQPQTCEHSQC